MRLILPALCASLLALSACAREAAAPKSDPAFGAKVRAYLLEHPEVIEEAVAQLNAKKQAAANDAAKAGIQKHRAALERDPRDFVANPGGKYTVVQFFDYRCGYCKLAAPEVEKLIAENPDVRFVFKEWPIFGEVSDVAARVAVTPEAKAKGLALYQALMAEKALDAAALDRHLTALGLDPVALKRAAATPAMHQHVRDTAALAASLGLEGTPAFIVGETMIPGADIEALRAAITQAKGGNLKRAPFLSKLDAPANS